MFGDVIRGTGQHNFKSVFCVLRIANSLGITMNQLAWVAGSLEVYLRGTLTITVVCKFCSLGVELWNRATSVTAQVDPTKLGCTVLLRDVPT